MPRKPPEAKTQKALADAFGITEAAVRKWLKDARWPFAARGPWKVADVRRWRRVALRNEAERSGVERDLKETKLQLQRLELSQRSGLVVDRQVHVDALLAIGETFIRALNELEQALPMKLASLDPPQIEEILADAFDNARRQIVAERDQKLAAAEGRKTRKARPGRPRSARAR